LPVRRDGQIPQFSWLATPVLPALHADRLVLDEPGPRYPAIAALINADASTQDETHGQAVAR
jgi:hypothetical protein